jgi:nicotinate phosphoribosyltransferase
MPEGTIAFAQEPLLAVTAPLVQAQILETFVLATIGFQSMIASKAARVRLAAGERTIADFGARRAHGPDAGLKAARAAYIGGIDATSLVLAGRHYGLPTTGTMAHSYVLAHSSELESFLTFARTFPDDAVLLIDTFDTLEGARIAAEAAARLAEESIEIDAVRLDSGDLGSLAVGVRQILDDAGFPGIRILASGGLDEYEIAALLEDGAPIDGFGVGTSLTTSGDAPSLDVVYKLVEDDGEPVMKTSTGKLTLPGRKQVFRTGDEGAFSGDTIALADEEGIEGTPLLARVVRAGSRTTDPEPLSDLRQRTLDGLDRLPDPLRTIEPGEPGPYPVRRSDRLDDLVVSLGGPSQDG